ncbi:S9 family peptidase [Dictyobacter kobayashii]|uniref:Putative peptidase YuxL n=1 Tax=Dictyobacter kobayashii TaxID=2014872 RepID=A0A402APV2_9CHLR|nr:S9 family peptidase [Dictyobacter kobayashii]GCE21193.1 putative peptidase YuxL [Dictyobacter kobayashii]
MSTLENEEPTTQRPQAVEQDDEPTTQFPSQPSQHPDAPKAQTPIEQPGDKQTAEEAAAQPQPAPAEAETETAAQPQETVGPASPDEQIPEQEPTSPDEATAEPIAQPEPTFPGTQASTIQVPIEQLPPRVAQSAPLEASIPVIPPMEPEDLLSLKIAADPQISPDGRLIAYTLLECTTEDNTTHSAIWLVESAAGKAAAPRKLSSGSYHDNIPRWSPDGQSLAFLSNRSGISQIYLLTLNGGEAQQVSNLPQGVTEYSWHPNGQILLAHSAWKPQDEQIGAAPERFLNVYTRLGNQWDGAGYNHGRHQQLWLIPLSGNALRLTSEPVDLVQSCWSPDGQEIVFCANRRPNPDLSVSMALWVLTLSSGQMRRLTPEEGLAQKPAWSPDGRQIAYLYTPDQTEAGNIVPWIVDAQGGTPRLAVPGADAYTCQSWIIDELRDEYLTAPQWYPDSQALLVPVQERGQLHLYRLNLGQQTSERLTNGNGRYISPQLSENGQAIAFVRADWFTPGDIWCMDSTGKQPRKLTRVNDTILQSHRLSRPKRIHWQSFDGLEIEGWLYLPQLPENVKAPLIVCPHGGPSLAWGDSYVHEFQVLAGHGYAVLAPNIRGSAGYGEAFTRSVLNDWGGDDFKDLMAGIDHVIATEAVDGERLGISGLSYGGYMTNWSISQTTRFKAAVSRNGISYIPSAALLSDQTIWFNLSMKTWARQHERSALTRVEAIETPLLLLHAENDLRCPFNESQQLFVALRKRKQPVELIGYHETSHLMDWPAVGAPQQRLDRLRRTIQWFERLI